MATKTKERKQPEKTRKEKSAKKKTDKSAEKKETKKEKKKAEKVKRTLAESYERYKTYKGKQYTGMKIGGTHKWYYDQGVWRERKITPEQWELAYSVVKRRAGKAPKGSGVPVGTGYHWFILSHQFVEKLNANDYSTTMVGLKFKLAHKRASKGKWNVSDDTQRKKLIQALRDMADELEREPANMELVDIEFDYRGKHYKGYGVPVLTNCHEGVCFQLDITLNNKHIGIIRCTKNGWRITGEKSQGFTNAIGDYIYHCYQNKED